MQRLLGVCALSVLIIAEAHNPTACLGNQCDSSPLAADSIVDLVQVGLMTAVAEEATKAMPKIPNSTTNATTPVEENVPEDTGVAEDDEDDDDLVPSEELKQQLHNVCLQAFATALHSLGVEKLGDTKYLDDANLEDVGMKLVHRRKVRATGKASEEATITATPAGLLGVQDATSIECPDRANETSMLVAVRKELAKIGIEKFAEPLHALGVDSISDTGVLMDDELAAAGLQIVHVRRLRETIPIVSRLPARNPSGEIPLAKLGLGKVAESLRTLGVDTLQDIEYLDDSELAAEGLKLVHRRKVRAADELAELKHEQHIQSEEEAADEQTEIDLTTCQSFTGGTCESLACAESSKATCTSGRCVCADGSCAVDGVCVPRG